jgi:hypothetical protein
MNNIRTVRNAKTRGIAALLSALAVAGLAGCGREPALPPEAAAPAPRPPAAVEMAVAEPEPAVAPPAEEQLVVAEPIAEVPQAVAVQAPEPLSVDDAEAPPEVPDAVASAPASTEPAFEVIEVPSSAAVPPAEGDAGEEGFDPAKILGRELAPGEKLLSVASRWSDKNWLGEGWQKRSAVPVEDVTRSGLSNYPVLVTLRYEDGMKPDFADVRFTSADGITELPYAIESVKESHEATMRVRVPSISTSGYALVFAYFANQGAAAAADPGILDGFVPAEREPQASVADLTTRRAMEYIVVSPELTEQMNRLKAGVAATEAPPPELDHDTAAQPQP